MFSIRVYISGSFYIMERESGTNNYLHGDGSVLSMREYWPIREQAQAVLDKYQPPHVWKVGDILEYKGKVYVFILMCNNMQQLVGLGPFGRVGLLGGKYHIDVILAGATFLFNINDKLS